MRNRADDTIAYLALFILSLIAVAYFTEQRLPPRDESGLKRKYDSLNVVLQKERQQAETIIGEIGRRQDTINKLRIEIQELQEQRQSASRSHLSRSDSAIVADIRKWADRYLLND